MLNYAQIYTRVFNKPARSFARSDTAVQERAAPTRIEHWNAMWKWTVRKLLTLRPKDKTQAGVCAHEDMGTREIYFEASMTIVHDTDKHRCNKRFYVFIQGMFFNVFNFFFHVFI